MDLDESGFSDSLTERVLGAVFEVSNTLGAGFLEKVYLHALVRELSLRGIQVRAQVPFSVMYEGHCVGEYFADLVVEDWLVIELKCVDRLSNEHYGAMSQLSAGLWPDALSSCEFPEA